VVRSDTLVGTLGLLLALDEHILAHVFGRDVVAGRQDGLEENPWTIRLGYDLAVHADPDVTGALEDVHPVVRVPGMDEDFLVLLVPVVYVVLHLLTLLS